MKFLTAILGAVVILSSCTKTVTQKVDQAFSAIYTLNANQWGSSDGGYTYSTTLNVPEIDSYLSNNGAVIVYLSLDNGSTWEALPEVINGVSYGAVHTTGQVYLDMFAVDGSKITPPGGTWLAKVVLVDASALD